MIQIDQLLNNSSTITLCSKNNVKLTINTFFVDGILISTVNVISDGAIVHSGNNLVTAINKYNLHF